MAESTSTGGVEEDNKCCICLRVVDMTSFVKSAICGHRWCIDCIITWICSVGCAVDDTPCPVCRSKLFENQWCGLSTIEGSLVYRIPSKLTYVVRKAFRASHSTFDRIKYVKRALYIKSIDVSEIGVSSERVTITKRKVNRLVPLWRFMLVFTSIGWANCSSSSTTSIERGGRCATENSINARRTDRFLYTEIQAIGCKKRSATHRTIINYMNHIDFRGKEFRSRIEHLIQPEYIDKFLKELTVFCQTYPDVDVAHKYSLYKGHKLMDLCANPQILLIL